METTMKNPVRMRRLLLLALAAGLVLIMIGALLLQSPLHTPELGPVLLGLVIVGAVLAAPASTILSTLQIRALFAPDLRAELWDEQARANNQRAMSLGFIVMVMVTGYVLPMSVWIALPITPTLTGILLVGVVTYLGAFALFERAGDDA
jgi:hypothetical protein